MPSTYSTHTVPGFICVTDLNQGMSVTNDAENVVAELLEAGHDLKSNRVLYRDSEGIWDELRVRGGKFAGFQLLSAKDLEVAMAAATAGGRFKNPPNVLGTGI